VDGAEPVGFMACTLRCIVAITSVILKFTWYDHLKELEHINQYTGEPDTPVKELSSVAH